MFHDFCFWLILIEIEDLFKIAKCLESVDDAMFKRDESWAWDVATATKLHFFFSSDMTLTK